MSTEIRNAVIDTAEILLERECFFSIGITVRFDKTGFQGYGGCCLCAPKASEDWPDIGTGRKPTIYGQACLMKLMNVFEVTNFKDLVGKPCRVKGGGVSSRIEAIGHYLEDKWFSYDEVMRACGWEEKP